MTSEMVERVARAIVLDMHPETNWDYIKSVPHHPLYLSGLGWAREAIAAMRDPTGEMAEAIWARTGDPCWRENAIEAWQAGVDTALKTDP